MNGKITWKMIFDDFKSRHPSLRKLVWHWEPYGYLMIILKLKDGEQLTYDYMTHKAEFLQEKWK